MTTTFADEARPAVKTSVPPLPSPPSPLGTFLGLFSLGLGLWELVSPRSVANRTGVRYPGLLRAYGAREVAAGVGILASPSPAFWLWNRVAGDALDLATIAAAYQQGSADARQKAGVAAAAVLGVTVLDIVAALEHGRAE